MHIKEDKLDREIYWVLQKMRLISLSPKNTEDGYKFDFGIIQEMYSPPFEQQRNVITMLDEWHVITLTKALDSSKNESAVKDSVTFFYRPAEKFDDYFWGLIDKITYIDAHLDALEQGVKFDLEMNEGEIFLNAPYGRFKVNHGQLRVEGNPRLVFDYLINKYPDKLVTTNELKKAGIALSRDLQQVAIKAGFKQHIRGFFMPVYEKEALQVKPYAYLAIKDAQLLIDALMKEPDNFNAISNQLSK
jgi:hypothetical protein